MVLALPRACGKLCGLSKPGVVGSTSINTWAAWRRLFNSPSRLKALTLQSFLKTEMPPVGTEQQSTPCVHPFLMLSLALRLYLLSVGGGGKGQRWRELACELLLWVLGGVLFGRKQIR